MKSLYVGQEAAGQTIHHVAIIDDVERTIECYAKDGTLLQTIIEPLAPTTRTERPQP